MTFSRPLPPHADAYFEQQLRSGQSHLAELPELPASTLNRVLAWYQRNLRGRALLHHLCLPWIVIVLFVLFLREEFWLWLDRADWRAIDRKLTFAGQSFLGLAVLYLLFEILLAFNSGAL